MTAEEMLKGLSTDTITVVPFGKEARRAPTDLHLTRHVVYRTHLLALCEFALSIAALRNLVEPEGMRGHLEHDAHCPSMGTGDIDDCECGIVEANDAYQELLRLGILD